MSNSDEKEEINPNNDLIVSNAPIDTIQQLKWNSKKNLLATGSWDCNVNCYKYNNDTNSAKLLATHQNPKPVLSVCWNSNTDTIYSGGCDNIISMWNPLTQHSTMIGKHDAPIKQVLYSTEHNYIISGSWDKKICFWDSKQDTTKITKNDKKNKIKNIYEIDVKKKIFSMCIKDNLIACGLSSKKILIFDVRNPKKIYKEIITTLNNQIRCMDFLKLENGLAICSVEGRCYIKYFDDDNKTFSFKCHQNNKNIYNVNAIKFNNKYDTFITAGSDGSIKIWDKDKQKLVKKFKKMHLPVNDIDLNFDDSLFAYTVSYDWNKGIKGFKPDVMVPQLYIHKIKPNEIYNDS